MIGDLGVAASLQGFRLIEVLKQGMAKEDIQYGDMRMHFCKAPNTVELTAIFKNLLSPPVGCKYYFCYFSDDSCLSIRMDDGSVRTYNLDISGCDGSHTEALFRALVTITPEVAQADTQAIVDQCKLPIAIRFQGQAVESPDADVEDNRVATLCLQPIDPLTGKKAPRLYSGSTATTVINNLACILGAVAVQEQQADDDQSITKAFATAGYKMSVELCHDYSDIQFLKNSPAYDITGELRPLLNLGVLLRSAGTCKGDLPGKKTESFELRHAQYMGSLISGMYPGIHFPLVDTMRKWTAKGSTRTDALVKQQMAYKHTFEGTATFTAEEVYRRYRLSDLEIMEIDLDYAPSGYGHYFNSSGASTILKRDYGLRCLDNWELPYEDRGYN
jgi:hypothetical protein